MDNYINNFENVLFSIFFSILLSPFLILSYMNYVIFYHTKISVILQPEAQI